MKRKLLAIALCTMMTAALIGCGGNTSGANTSSGSAASQASAEESAETGGGEVETVSIDPVHVTVTFGWSSSHQWVENFVKPLLDGVAAKTDGAFSYDLFTDGELVGLTYELDALRQGQADIAFSLAPFYDQSRFPLASVTALPCYNLDNVISSAAIKMLWESDKELRDGKTWTQFEFTDNGVVAWPNSNNDTQYMCLNKGIDMSSASAYQANIRLRSPGTASEIFIRNMGMTPVSMPGTEIYDALSRGALEGVLMTPDWYSLSFTPFFGDVVAVSQGCLDAFVAMPIDLWESWPQELQDVWNECWEEAFASGTTAITANSQMNFDELEKEGGRVVQLDELDQDAQDLIANAAAQTWYDWIDSVEEQGFPAKEAAILWRDCLIECGSSVADELMNLEDYVPNSR